VVGLSTDDLEEGLGDLEEFLGLDFDSKFILAEDINELSDKFQVAQDQIKSLANAIYVLQYISPISSSVSAVNTLRIEIDGNINEGTDGFIETSFNSVGF